MKQLQHLFWVAIACLQVCCVKPQMTGPAADDATTANKVKAQVNALAVGDLSDTNIKYFGRWDFSNTAQYSSAWGGAYLRVNFTGTTVKMKIGNGTWYFAKIDNGPWKKFVTTGAGTVNLTPTPLANGTHTLSIAQGKDYNYQFNFQGLVLDAGATTSAPAVSSTLIEWIGDSITAGYTDSLANVSGYPWVLSEMLGVEHTQIAYPGIRLVSGFPAGNVGMDVQYFKLHNPSVANSPDWDFTRYTPRLVVINLGTNDNGQAVPDATLQSTFTTFLANVRTKFPNAEIFVMRTFLGVKATPTLAAVNARIAAGDTKLHYIDTNGWMTNADYSDGLHPSEAGNIKAANLLRPILEPYLTGTPPQALPNGTYKIINRNSGLSLDAKDKLTANGTAIQQWSYGAGTNQQWVVTSLGNGSYKITGVQSARSLDVKDKSTADGAAIQLWDYKTTGNENQNWVLTSTSGGYYTIKSVYSGKLVEVAGSSTANGALVQQWASTNANNQQWAFQAP